MSAHEAASSQVDRAPELVKEELSDLLAYLGGLPAGLKRGRAFAAYEERVAELSRELLLNELSEMVARRFEAGTAAPDARYAALRGDLQQREGAQNAAFRRSRRLALLARVASAVALAGFVIDGWVAPLDALGGHPERGLALCASLVVAFHLLGTYLTRVAHAARSRAALLASLSDELGDTLGPRGELLGPAEYYPARTRRIERLITDLQSQSHHDGWVPRGA